jgi:hypothetical protein
MARGRARTTPTQNLPTNIARDQFYKLVNRLSRLNRASRSLLDRAVEVGPRGRGGVVLVPKVDAEAAMTRTEELEDRIVELEAELEDLTLARFVEDRLQTPREDLIDVEELAERVGRGRLLADR